MIWNCLLFFWIAWIVLGFIHLKGMFLPIDILEFLKVPGITNKFWKWMIKLAMFQFPRVLLLKNIDGMIRLWSSTHKDDGVCRL